MNRLSEMPLVFVYGSLRRGCSNDITERIKDVQFLGNATIGGTLYEVNGHPFPGILLNDTNKAVIGEVYEVTLEALRWLDAFEGYNSADDALSYYMRREIIAQLGDGKQVKCHAYEINRDKFELGNIVESGDWKQHTLQNLFTRKPRIWRLGHTSRWCA